MSFDLARLGFLLLFMMPPAAAGQHRLFDSLLKDHVTDGAVDYTALRKDTRLDAYLASVSAIDPVSIRDRDDRLAHWINAYNAFTLKLIAANPGVRSIREIGAGGNGPWDSVWIPLGGRRYSLNGIEHDVIRKDFDEPRIHLALVCAARSCPPLRSEAYTGDRLTAQLESNARRFLLDSTANRYDAATNTLYLSQLFSWYGEDFRSRYGSAAAYVLSVMGRNPAKPPTVRYLTYDWSLNDHQPPAR